MSGQILFVEFLSKCTILSLFCKHLYHIGSQYLYAKYNFIILKGKYLGSLCPDIQLLAVGAFEIICSILYVILSSILKDMCLHFRQCALRVESHFPAYMWMANQKKR